MITSRASLASRGRSARRVSVPATSCLAGQVECSGKCVDPLTDNAYCGAKTAGNCDSVDAADDNFQGIACLAGQVCAAGVCATSCLAGQVECGGKCVDPLTDNAYCGAKTAGSCDSIDAADDSFQGVACVAGQVCAAGVCATSCLAGQVECGGKCVDPLTDNAYCGAKTAGSCDSVDAANDNFQGVACVAGQVCAAGVCATSCLTGQVECGGQCVDPLTDNAYCGAKTVGNCDSVDAADDNFQGVSCLSGQVCAAGVCATSCLTGQVECGGQCVDPLTDNAYCGAKTAGSCDSVDAADDNFQGVACLAGQVCAAGVCATSCLAGQVECGGKCVDPLTDNAYCGAHAAGNCDSTNVADINFQGVACLAGQVCAAGACATSCLTGQVQCGGQCIDPQVNNTFCGAAVGGSCDSTTSTDANYQGATCSAVERCTAGSCTSSCATDQLLCSGKCIDPLSDRIYCGATSDCQGTNVGVSCAAGNACYVGRCVTLPMAPWDSTLFPLSVTGASYGLGQMTFDSAGNIYMAGYGNKAVYRVDHLTGAVTAVATALAVGSMLAITYSPSNDLLYIAGSGTLLYSLTMDGTVLTTVSSAASTTEIESLALAPPSFGVYGGQIITADRAGNIHAVTTTGAVTFIGKTAGSLSAIAFAADGRLFAAGGSTIYQISAAGVVTTVNTSFSAAEGLTFDNAGNRLFVSDSNRDDLWQITFPAGTATKLGDYDFDSGYYPEGLLFDGANVIARTGENSSTLLVFTP